MTASHHMDPEAEGRSMNGPVFVARPLRHLTPSEAKVYALATFDWRPLPSKMSATALTALKAKRLVETRFSKGDPNHLAVAEWRRTPKE